MTMSLSSWTFVYFLNKYLLRPYQEQNIVQGAKNTAMGKKKKKKQINVSALKEFTFTWAETGQ